MFAFGVRPAAPRSNYDVASAGAEAITAAGDGGDDCVKDGDEVGRVLGWGTRPPSLPSFPSRLPWLTCVGVSR